MSKKLMAHLVYGYPDRSTSRSLLRHMTSSGVEYVEIQIPFSDPLADGLILTHANAIAATNTNVDDVLHDLSLVASAPSTTKIVLMSYFHSIFAYGIEKYCRRAAEAGVVGIIVPDLPYDQPEYEVLAAQCKLHSLDLIPVLSPNMSRERLVRYISKETPLVYVTARLGVTGSHTDSRQIDNVAEFVHEVKASNPECLIALGFGIQTPEDIARLPAGVAIAVVGSAITDRINKAGLGQTKLFIAELLAACLAHKY